MINSFVNGILSAIFEFLTFLVGLVTRPLYLVLESLFPDFTNYMTDWNNFLEHYIFNGLAFAREVFLNITGLPRDLWVFCVWLLVSMFVLSISATGLIFFMNLFQAWKRGI